MSSPSRRLTIEILRCWYTVPQLINRTPAAACMAPRWQAGRPASQLPRPTSAGWSPAKVLLMVAGVRLQAGHAHRGKVVTVAIDDSQFRILHAGTQLSAHPGTIIKEVIHRCTSGHSNYQI